MPTSVPLRKGPKNLPHINILPSRTPLGAAYFPLRWLLAAYWDLRRAPVVSLSYSGLVIGAAYLSLSNLYASQSFHLLLPIGALLILIAPSFFCGFVTVSRHLENNRAVSLKSIFTEDFRDDWCYIIMGTIIMLVLFFWLQLALILLAFVVHMLAFPLPLESLSWAALLSPQTLPWMLVAAITGLAVMVVIFSMTVIASALLLDRSLDVFSAMWLSARSAKCNWRSMATWGFFVALLAGLGMAISYLVLVLVMPLIGHASWHAYRDLIQR